MLTKLPLSRVFFEGESDITPYYLSNRNYIIIEGRTLKETTVCLKIKN